MCIGICIYLLNICVCLPTGNTILPVGPADMELQQPCLSRASGFSPWGVCLISPEGGVNCTAGCLVLTIVKSLILGRTLSQSEL